MRCEICGYLRHIGFMAHTLRRTGVVGERRVIDHCADRLVCRTAAAVEALWEPGDRQYWDVEGES